MSLIESAKLNGHDPYRYLRDVLDRVPIQPVSRLENAPQLDAIVNALIR
jgi:hypothetical protein